MPAFDPKKVEADLKWLQANPAFHEKPASIIEFLGPDYLDIEEGIRPGVRQALIDIFGEDVNPKRIAKFRWGMFTGAIGIGKTTMASIILPYMVHWVLCLIDPQKFFNLLPGSRIAFMMMSTSEDQAKETLFGDVKARIQHSPWFQNNWSFDPDFKNQLRFPKDIWILPGSSKETSFEGYNILGGILDEADSHQVTATKDYADDGWNTINSRIDSRFQDRGFLLTVGQMKKSSGFAATKYKELCDDPENAYTVRMTIWESLGWDHPSFCNPDGSRKSFWYDKKRKEIVSWEAAQLLGYPDHIIEIPKVYEKTFKTKPEKALRDLAGIPPISGDAFISLTYKIEEAVERWKIRYGDESPVSADCRQPQLAEWFKDPTPLRRAVHLDIGVSGDGDAAGIVMGHVNHMVEATDTEGPKPYIVIDCMIRVKAASGQEVMIADLRGYVYQLTGRGFRIKDVSMDGFQSTDTKQQLRKKRYRVHALSVDKSKLPYEDLRDALYEDRIELPPYFTYIAPGDGELLLIANRELEQLVDDGKKVDHPANGSKDVADGLAGVTTTLMGDRAYRRRVGSAEPTEEPEEVDTHNPFSTSTQDPFDQFRPRMPGLTGSGLQAPIPPTIPTAPIPASLRGRNR